MARSWQQDRGTAALRGVSLKAAEVKLVKLGPGLAGDGRDQDRRAPHHQLPSLAAGEIQEGIAAGAIRAGSRRHMPTCRPLEESVHAISGGHSCKGSRKRAAGRLEVAESTKALQLLLRDLTVRATAAV
ncbi:UNVERIFIED_ORG: hypothetical protein M2179_003666 [Bradyrhizobium japonicum]